MTDADIQIDTTLGEQGVKHARSYVEKHVDWPLVSEKDWPVKRSQIYGMYQIVAHEPSHLRKFATKQGERAKKRNEGRKDPHPIIEAEIGFWNLIDSLCTGNRNPVWSLKKACEEMLVDLDFQTKQEQKRFRDDWLRRYWPLFFQRFCAEYLCLMALRTQENLHDDR